MKDTPSVSASVIRTLTHALIEANKTVSAGFNAVQEQPELATSVGSDRRFLKALKLRLELGSWLGPRIPRPKLSKAEKDRFAFDMIDKGVEPRLALELASARRKGAPVRKRWTTILAWELKLSNPSETWNTIANKFCTCGRDRHGFKCQEAIRRQIGHLKRVLRKYNITLS